MAGLVLEFSNLHGPARRLGPYDKLSFEGEILTVVPGGFIANHVNHEWRLRDGAVCTTMLVEPA